MFDKNKHGKMVGKTTLECSSSIHLNADTFTTKRSHHSKQCLSSLIKFKSDPCVTLNVCYPRITCKKM